MASIYLSYNNIYNLVRGILLGILFKSTHLKICNKKSRIDKSIIFEWKYGIESWRIKWI